MIILHLENNDVTRDALARLVEVKGGQLGSFQYLATGVSGVARKHLQQGTVLAVVLDLGLNVTWDNKHMIRVLRHLAFNEELVDTDAPTTCESHGIALLAHQHKVPCALLTNYADYVGGDPPLTADKLAETFYAREVFRKDDDGMKSCARWLRKKAGMLT